jgi:type I restriction enzyme S subunit
LGEVGKIICGKTPSKANKKFYGEDIPFIKIPDMHGQMFVVNTIDNLSNLGAISQKKKMIPTNSMPPLRQFIANLVFTEPLFKNSLCGGF